jgi:anti-sigma factor (TIGR02949 family)
MADDIKTCGDLDEHLAAFVDGEAAPGARGAIAAHLAACPPCRMRAEAERSARDIVRDHRAALCPQAPAALRERCSRLRQGDVGPRASSFLRKWAPLSVAATLVLAVAGVFLFGLNNRVEALAASLTVDHVKCFKVSGAAGRADAAAAARTWEQDHGWAVTVPPGTAAEQLQLVDVRRCFSTDGRAAHMMYSWRGAPLSLYVVPENARYEQVVRKMGHQTVIWCVNQRTYAVVADGQSPQELTRVVEYLKANAK